MPIGVTADSLACANCRRNITSTYYQIGAAHVCPACRDAVYHAVNTSGKFGRAALFGFGAALVGAVVWYAIRAATGYEIGLVALFIGIIVGMAVRKGSMSAGGRRYQILALILTYISITMANIPEIISAVAKSGESSASAAATAASSAPPSAVEFIVALGFLFLLALVSPFLAGFENILGIIIIGFGLYQAWKINTRQDLSIQGPFTVISPQPQANSVEPTPSEADASG